MEPKQDRLRVVVHLRSGRTLDVWVPKSETIKPINLTDDTAWTLAARRMFASDTAKYIVLGSQIEYFEVL